MANAIITLKIMPESPDEDLQVIEAAAKEKIIAFAGEGEQRVEIEPVAFGLKAIKILFVMDESKGSPDALEEAINTIAGVQSVTVVDVRRAIG